MKYKFHNLDFSLNERKSIEAYSDERKWEIADILETSIELGVKVSFSYDEYHSCARMSLTATVEEHPFYGYIVTVRHSSLSRLFVVLLWLTSEGWDQLEPPTGTTSKYDW